MAIDSVSKVQAVCHSSARDGMVAVLESSGSFHPVCREEGHDWLLPAGTDTTMLAGQIDELEAVIGFLREFVPKPGFSERMGAVPRSVPAERLSALLEDDELLWRARRAWRIAMLISERSGDLRETVEEISFLEGWSGLPCAFDELGRHGSFTAQAGSCPAENAPALVELGRSEPLLSVEPAGQSTRREPARLLVVTHDGAPEEVRQEIVRLGFSAVDFAARRGSVRKLLEASELRRKALEKRIETFRAEAAGLAADLPALEELRDAAGMLLERLSAAGSGLRGDRLFLIRGWVRNRDLGALEKSVSGLGDAFLERIEPEEGEVPPSAATEPGLIDPYMMLTEMFGSPSPADPDPTPLMAPFYALFLGICVGDAGYGAVLALVSGLGLLSARRRGQRNRLFGVLFQGGLAAMVVGVFFGGWFGMDRALLPAFLAAPARLLDSLVPGGAAYSTSMQFLYTTMALGIVQLLAGVVVNFVKRWKAGERLTVILEQTGWILSTLGLFPWLFNHYLLVGVLYDSSGPLDRVFLMSLLVGAVLIFVMGGREAKGFGKVGLGAMAAYGIVNLLADALSYSRLFALSLSGGIIATVVNQISRMLPGTDIPGVGLLITIPVLIGGHLFNIAMSVLGGFIHTARLQVVEFFGKFYEGTGTPFSPLRYRPQYVNIVRKNPEGGSR